MNRSTRIITAVAGLALTAALAGCSASHSVAKSDDAPKPAVTASAAPVQTTAKPLAKTPPQVGDELTQDEAREFFSDNGGIPTDDGTWVFSDGTSYVLVNINKPLPANVVAAVSAQAKSKTFTGDFLTGVNGANTMEGKLASETGKNIVMLAQYTGANLTTHTNTAQWGVFGPMSFNKQLPSGGYYATEEAARAEAQALIGKQSDPQTYEVVVGN